MTEERLNEIADKIYDLERKKIKLLDKLFEKDENFASEVLEVLNDESQMRS